jgi:hypothetical protein
MKFYEAINKKIWNDYGGKNPISSGSGIYFPEKTLKKLKKLYWPTDYESLVDFFKKIDRRNYIKMINAALEQNIIRYDGESGMYFLNV